MSKRTNKPFDPEWTIHNDLQSVTVGINTRIGILRKQGLVPTLIRLGMYHTRLFMKEACLDYIPNKKPARIIHSGLAWDDENKRLCYLSVTKVPFKFNDRSIYGIAVEGRPEPNPSTQPRGKSS
ncbi:MAG: hypothetical protein ACM3ZU_08020 [Bacteroidota bacterium]